jgi:hypothetical protein
VNGRVDFARNLRLAAALTIFVAMAGKSMGQTPAFSKLWNQLDAGDLQAIPVFRQHWQKYRPMVMAKLRHGWEVDRWTALGIINECDEPLAKSLCLEFLGQSKFRMLRVHALAYATKHKYGAALPLVTKLLSEPLGPIGTRAMKALAVLDPNHAPKLIADRLLRDPMPNAIGGLLTFKVGLEILRSSRDQTQFRRVVWLRRDSIRRQLEILKSIDLIMRKN